MQCSLCANVALRHVRIGKKLRGFCGDHTQEAFVYSKELNKPKIVGYSDYESGMGKQKNGARQHNMPYNKHKDYKHIHTL